MNKNLFLCPHCKTPCSTSGINCPQCQRQVRNPPTAKARQNTSRFPLLRIILVAVISAVFAVVILMTVFTGKI